MVKNLTAMQEKWVQALGEEDPPEKGRQPTPVSLPGESHGYMGYHECLMVLNSTFTKTIYIDLPPLLLWSSLSELSEMLPPRLQSSCCPK